MMTEEKKRTLLEIIRNKKRVLARKLRQNGKKVLLVGGLLGALSMTTKSSAAQSVPKDKKVNKSELLADAAKPSAAKMAEYMMYADVNIDETIDDVVENDILVFQKALEKGFQKVSSFKGNRMKTFGGGQNYCAMFPSKIFNEVARKDSMDYVKDLYGSLSNQNLCSAVRDDIKNMFPQLGIKRQKVTEMKDLKNGDFLIIDMTNARPGQANTSSGLHFVVYFEGKFKEITSKLDADDVSSNEAFDKNAKGKILSFNNESYNSFSDSYFSKRYGWRIPTSEILKSVLRDKIYEMSSLEQKKYLYNQSARIGEDFDYYKENKSKKKTILARKKKIEKKNLENITLASADLSVQTPEVSVDVEKNVKNINQNLKQIKHAQQRGNN